ncbi:MAG TPA: hypothetical protein VMB78_01800, partial [Dissulfurispiraceae bacterium]|nr:hypothetical protein [Dissulfurispiraceae bacterium]
GPQGCDVEPIMQRSPESWSDILGTVRRELLEVIRGIDKSEDVAGSRIWCALEALRKATDMHESNLTYDRQIDDCVIFNGGRLAILTFPIKLLRGHKRMVAVTVANRNSDHIQTVKTCKNACSSIDHDKRLFMDGGPQGQSMFAHRFLLGLKANAAVGGGIYFATYFDLIGKMREYALKPIGKYISDDFLKGNFMVTNYSRTDIWGHAANHETIDAHVWVEKIFGYEDSSLILHFDWGKVMPDGTTKPIASSRHQTSWIKVIGHGIVEPVPCPQYFKDFLKDNRLIPSGNYDAATLELPDNAALSNDQLGNILQQYNVLEPTDRVLADIFIDTTREHSNLAQNVYFSNYFSWQGQLRDKYLHSLSAEVYGKMDRRGRFACINSEVTHLREAMPFDSIYISVKLKTLYECGLDLYFEYFKMIPDGGKIKLAYGSHTLAWIYVDDLDNYVTQHIPEAYLKLMVATDHRILPS